LVPEPSKESSRHATLHGPQDYWIGANVNPSVLDLYILSLLDRGLQTPYDLHSKGGLSLGSTLPALRRLEEAGLVRKKAPSGSSKRPRHCFQVSAAGRKMARGGWIQLLKDQPPSDFDAVLRLVDIAQHYQAKDADVVAFLTAASSERRSPTKSGRTRLKAADSLGIMVTREAWDTSRLQAEAKFLAELAKSVARDAPRIAKR
jgi:DNA-binding PadR family transcriptional regulator